LKSGVKLCAAIIVLSLLFVGVTYAGILSYFGKIVTTVDVHQSVWLDGQEGPPTVTDVIDEPSPGGESFCFKHWLENHASIPVTVAFATTYSPSLWDNEIVTEIYELTGWKYTIEEGRENYAGPIVDLDDPGDPYTTLGNVELEVSYEDGEKGWVVFTVTTPAGLIGSTAETYSGSVVFQFDDDADGLTDWQVSYEPGSLMWAFMGNWGYEEALETGVNPDPREFEDATLREDIQVARDGDQFILKVDFEKLGGCGGSYKFGLYISHLTEYWGGIPGGADQVMIFFPDFDTFNWVDTSGYEIRTVGTETTQITIPSRETVHFCICYTFAVDISPGLYTIITEIQPA
jgi:hypothetical protein